MASLEGLWAVRFESSSRFVGAGGGVVVFETNRVFGGDSGWYYLGEYKVINGEIEASMEVRHHGENLLTIFGDVPGDIVKIKMTAKFSGGNEFKATGQKIPSNETMELEFKKLADLPNPS